MSPIVLAALIALFSTSLTVVGGLLLARMLRPTELITALQTERTDMAARLTAVERKVETLTMRGRYWEDYVNELRQWIEDEKGPPPPSYPRGLLRIDMGGP